MARIDLAALNPEQRRAVVHMSGPMLILAGAGSGKTRVITHRIAHLVERGIHPSRILAVSFTNKAAREMAERVASVLGPKVAKKCTLSTFHSLGHSILRKDIAQLGYEVPFSILDEGDQKEIVREIFAELNYDPKVVDPRRVVALIGLAKMALSRPGELESLRFDPDAMIAERVFDRYQSALRGRNAVDFDDLICLPVRLFRTHEEVRARWAERYRYVMIDEYQDTNRTQLMLVDELVKDHHNLCVVGDDDQSIYGFRGAVSDNILGFEREYAQTTIIKLEQNYRSTNVILGAANAVIARNAKRKAKRLWSATEGGDPIAWVACDDERQEAEFVAAQIERLSQSGVPLDEIAILYRSNAQARPFEEALRQSEISYDVVGGTEFYDRKEIKDLVGYLQSCLNPRLGNAVRRVVNVPPRGIGPVLLERLSDFAHAHGMSFHEALGWAVDHPGDIEGLGPRARQKLGEFLAIVAEFGARFERAGSEEHGDAGEVARALVVALHYTDHVRSQEKSAKIARRRVENIESLLSDLSAFSARRGAALDRYLARLMLDRSTMGDQEKKAGAVRLMTLHSSKGLEFPVVFLVGLEEGFLPHENSRDTEREIAEERRLFYVGITRAKRSLWLTSAAERKRYGKTIAREVSRFAAEIPAELVRAERGQGSDALLEAQGKRNEKYLSIARQLFGDERAKERAE